MPGESPLLYRRKPASASLLCTRARASAGTDVYIRGRLALFLCIHGGLPLHAVRRVSMIGRVIRLAVTHPRLLGGLFATAWRFRARGWFRRPPFLPVPPASYLAWRLDTAYGRPDVVPPSRDMESYLHWVVTMRRGARK